MQSLQGDNCLVARPAEAKDRQHHFQQHLTWGRNLICAGDKPCWPPVVPNDPDGNVVALLSSVLSESHGAADGGSTSSSRDIGIVHDMGIVNEHKRRAEDDGAPLSEPSLLPVNLSTMSPTTDGTDEPNPMTWITRNDGTTTPSTWCTTLLRSTQRAETFVNQVFTMDVSSQDPIDMEGDDDDFIHDLDSVLTMLLDSDQGVTIGLAAHTRRGISFG